MLPDDWETVSRIYQEGMDSGLSTFETRVPEWKDWSVRQIPGLMFVAEEGGEVIGWTSLSQVSPREVYKGVTEVGTYIDSKWYRRGVGKALLDHIIKESENAGIWTIQAVMFPENEASYHLHLKLGFREVGRRVKVGKHHGRWRDTVMLERRSKKVI